MECDPQMRLETAQPSHYFLHITNHHLFCLWHTQMILPVELSNTDYIDYTFSHHQAYKIIRTCQLRQRKVTTLKWQNLRVLWDIQLSLFNEEGGGSLTEMSIRSYIFSTCIHNFTPFFFLEGFHLNNLVCGWCTVLCSFQSTVLCCCKHNYIYNGYTPTPLRSLNR